LIPFARPDDPVNIIDISSEMIHQYQPFDFQGHITGTQARVGQYFHLTFPSITIPVSVGMFYVPASLHLMP
jgi:hypothetical protein